MYGRPCCLILAAAVAAAAGGCGQNADGLRYAPVSGVVTVGGEPAAGVTVLFRPAPSEGKTVTGSPSAGMTDADGRYELKTIRGSGVAGAVVGTHQVTVSGREDYSEADLQEQIALGNPAPEISIPTDASAGLTFTVEPAGSTSADFAF
ncbi:MAG: hypothetical protein AAF532_10575 [Planctomycetota bacterium]